MIQLSTAFAQCRYNILDGGNENIIANMHG